MMELILKLWRPLAKLFNTTFGSQNNSIPNEISRSEKLIRGIYSPINIKHNKATNLITLKPNAFKSPPEQDEVSVLRLPFTTATFCKIFSRRIEKPEKDRTYIGLAVIDYHEVLATNAWAVSSPIPNAPMHADIKIGYKVSKNEPLPAAYNLIVTELAKAARYKPDPHPSGPKWEGEELV